MREITGARARRIALAAQGFAAPRPRGRVDRRHLRALVRRLGLLQIDSVNVLERAHYLPAFSRLGPYPKELLDRMAWTDHELFEYWAHEASLLPAELWPVMRRRQMTEKKWRHIHAIEAERPNYLAEVLAHVRAHGPVSPAGLPDPGDGGGKWWGWSPGKTALEYLFLKGEVTAAGRRNFARLYDVPERVLPADLLAAPVPAAEEAMRIQLRRGAEALGIGTAADIADYFRINVPAARKAIAQMAKDGELEEVRVEGWKQPAFLWPGAKEPRRPIEARALLSPFDPLVWCRPRVERLFGFHYRIEIYVPAPKRVHGYYVLPFLLGEDLVGRVDLKADRAAGRLLVQAAYVEEGRDPGGVAGPLAEELRSMASWLGLGGVACASRGSLAAALRRALRTSTA